VLKKKRGQEDKDRKRGEEGEKRGKLGKFGEGESSLKNFVCKVRLSLFVNWQA
jgi:hypothetical protein